MNIKILVQNEMENGVICMDEYFLNDICQVVNELSGIRQRTNRKTLQNYEACELLKHTTKF